MQSESCRLDKRQRPAPVKHGPVLFKFIYTEWRGGVETERGRNYFESKFDRSATFFAILSWNLENTKLERWNLLSLVSQLYARTHAHLFFTECDFSTARVPIRIEIPLGNSIHTQLRPI